MTLSEWPEHFKEDNRRQDAIEVVVDAVVSVVTERAVGLDIGDDDLLWLPKSQCPCIADAEVGDEYKSVDMPEWLAEDKGLI